MKPLSAWPVEQRRGIIGVLTDIDDTLTTDGAITPDAASALAHMISRGQQQRHQTGEAEDAAGSHRQ